MKISSHCRGNYAMLSYVIVTALSSILIHDITQKISPFLSAFYTFLFCTLFYNILSIKAFESYIKLKKWWWEVFLLNTTTAICWISAFASLKYIPADLFLFVYLCVIPIVSACLYKKNLGKVLILTSGIVLLVSTYHQDNTLLGSMFAFIGGLFATIYSIYSKKISVEFSTREILSLRFYLIVILTFIINIYYKNSFSVGINFYEKFAILCLISVILPLTLFQIGIKNLDLHKALAFLPLAPILCYGFSYFQSHSQFNILQLLAIILLTFSMLPIPALINWILRIKQRA